MRDYIFNITVQKILNIGSYKGEPENMRKRVLYFNLLNDFFPRKDN